VDGITSGTPGGTLTFTGLDLVALATVNGSINLTSDVSFQDLSVLAMYARGTGSDLTLDSPISNIGTLDLAAEGSIQLTNPGTMSVGEFEATAGNNLTLRIGGSLLLNGKVRLDTLVLPGTTVASGANLTLNITGDYMNSSTGDLSTFQLTNQGTINQSGNISLGVNGNLNCANGVQILVNNELDSGVSATHGGTIGGDSSISVSASTVSTGGVFVDLLNENDQGGTGTAGGHIGGTASIAINVNGALTTNANNPNAGLEPGVFDVFISNYGFGDGSPGGFIGSNASVSIAATSISTAADFNIGISNDSGGTIGGAARVSVTAGSMSVDEFSAQIGNGNFTGGTGSVGGQIAGAASITFNITGALNVAGGTDNDMDEPSGMPFVIDNSGFGDGSPAGSIGSDASIDITAGSISDDGRTLLFGIFNSAGGMIGGNASITVTANSISAAGPGPTGAGENLQLLIDNSAAGNINGSATISLNAGSVSTVGGLFADIFNGGGHIGGNATAILNTTGNVDSSAGFFLNISNNGGGIIGRDATINLAAAALSAGLQETVIFNNDGIINGKAAVDDQISGNVVATGDTFFDILNNDAGSGAGTIGSDATITLNAANITTSGNFNEIINNGTGGHIAGTASVTLALSGDLTSQSGAFIQIDNFDASIGGNATINVSAGNLTANSMLAQIENTGGAIGGNATINMNVSGTATVTNDTTIEVLGSDGAAGAAINFNGGSYDAGGTFLAEIDGSGTITFNNASVHANVLQVGALGTSGVLNIGGGTLSADTTLKLYANSSNGTVNFIADVTLTGASTKIIAGDTVKVFDNVVVTIGMSPADIYTNHAHYSSSNGGDGTTNGIFTASGFTGPAVTTHLSATPPPFNDPPLSAATVTSVTSGGNVTSGKKTGAVMNVSDSGQLLSLLDGATPGPGGKITIPASKSTSNWRDSSGINAAGRLNAGRDAADIRDAHSLAAGRLP